MKSEEGEEWRMEVGDERDIDTSFYNMKKTKKISIRIKSLK